MTPLLKLTRQTNLQSRLLLALQDGQISTLRETLYNLFDSKFILTCCNRIVVDLADTCLMIADERDDLLGFLQDFSNNIQILINNYHHKRKEAIANFAKTYQTCGLNFPKLAELKTLSTVTPDQYQAGIKALSAYGEYLSYTSGYQHDRYLECFYLKNWIDETLAKNH